MLNITKIESLIKEKGWSNSYFSSLFGKNAGWIRDWKRGRGLPDSNVLDAIADELCTTVDYLTDKTDIKNKPAADKGNGLSEEDNIMLQEFLTLTPEKRKFILEMMHGLNASGGHMLDFETDTKQAISTAHGQLCLYYANKN